MSPSKEKFDTTLPLTQLSGITILLVSWFSLVSLNAYTLVCQSGAQVAGYSQRIIFLAVVTSLAIVVTIVCLSANLRRQSAALRMRYRNLLGRIWLLLFLSQLLVHFLQRGSTRVGLYSLLLFLSLILLFLACYEQRLSMTAVQVFGVVLSLYVLTGVAIDLFGLHFMEPQLPSRLDHLGIAQPLLRMSGLFTGVGYLGSAGAVLTAFAMTSRRRYSLPVLAIGLTSLTLSDSRSGIGAVTLSAALILTMQFVRRGVQARNCLGPIITCIFGFAYVVLLGYEGIVSGLDARLTIWTNALNRSLLPAVPNATAPPPLGISRTSDAMPVDISRTSDAIAPFVLGNHAHNLLLDAWNMPIARMAIVFVLIALTLVIASLAIWRGSYVAFALISVPLFLGALDKSIDWAYPSTPTVSVILGILAVTLHQTLGLDAERVKPTLLN